MRKKKATKGKATGPRRAVTPRQEDTPPGGGIIRVRCGGGYRITRQRAPY